MILMMDNSQLTHKSSIADERVIKKLTIEIICEIEYW